MTSLLLPALLTILFLGGPASVPQGSAASRPVQSDLQPTYEDNEYLQLDVCLMMYLNSWNDSKSDSDIDDLLGEVAQAEEFFWRNSEMYCDLNITYLVIERTLYENQFWEVWEDAYWLPFWKVDSQHSVEQDLYDLGYTDNTFDGVVVFYCWKDDDDHHAAYGGGTYGVDIGFHGDTGYTAIPWCWDPDSNDWYMIHEFHHQLDSMFYWSGYPEYPHADFPADYVGVFDEGYSFNAWMLRTWEKWKWFDLRWPWGSIQTYQDADDDDFPDTGPGFTITEETLGSSPELTDTEGDGFSDLEEAVAGILASSDPDDPDTDGDRRPDGTDTAPLDDANLLIPKGTPVLDGVIDDPAWRYIDHIASGYGGLELEADIYGAWDDDYLYFACAVDDELIEMPWNELWWCDSFLLHLDAKADGFLCQSDDNYEIYAGPRGAGGNADTYVCIWRDDGSQDEDYVPDSDVIAKYTKKGPHYYIEMAIKENEATGFSTGIGRKFRLMAEVIDYDTYPGWPHYRAFTEYLPFTMVKAIASPEPPQLTAPWGE
jgi:hypothetical protein